MASVTILYPSGHDFDLKYYLDTHMPLVSAQWKQDGLRSWEITQLDAGQPFQVQALLRWDSVAAWDAASTGPHGESVFADIPNFTTAQPVAVKGTTEAKADFGA
ncbi:Dimeric alpha-beta barrel [Moelleriella libera RCEF 2490]|uniref:Dimeric alpha-beta barrel n=1 Tax=Moelleriella libera RCEF 2490 TaxID=1081109 RepID=A0A168C426_9HYPO|nr:Dimeric alpha-beta barrel [Moelleriella libera RCEF 2490]